MKLIPSKVDPRDSAIVLMFAAALALPLNNGALVIGMGAAGAGLTQILNRVIVDKRNQG